MSTTATPNDSPLATPIQPLHNPNQAAHVVVPSAPLGNVGNQAPGMGAKALLAKKMAKTHNPNFISPTDNMMTPVTQKLTAAKKKHFAKGPKPVALFAQKEEEPDDQSSDEQAPDSKVNSSDTKMDEDENPF
ncbi:hypothetical protein ONZ45_g486 [Pleurotus djamor]|nr:hypothetical protein ONZ45_g486 [Pleurotus djamor]